jgi:hypothetical protein
LLIVVNSVHKLFPRLTVPVRAPISTVAYCEPRSEVSLWDRVRLGLVGSSRGGAVKAQLIDAIEAPNTRASRSKVTEAPRLALISMLVLLVALGVHGHLATPVWDTRSKLRDAVIMGVLEAGAITLIVALLARSRRAPPGQLVAARLRVALLTVLGAGALALVVLSLLLIRAGASEGTDHLLRHPRPRLGNPRPSLGAPPLAPGGSFHFPIAVFYGTLAAVLVGAIVALVWAVRKTRRPVPLEPLALAEEYGELLEEAIEGGRRALLSLDDARAAIIACYVAMEEALAQAGTKRTSAETPDELLAKAASTLLLNALPAQRLTSLFYEARFSSHRLGQDRRAAAEGALAMLSFELGGAHAVGAGGGP